MGVKETLTYMAWTVATLGGVGGAGYWACRDMTVSGALPAASKERGATASSTSVGAIDRSQPTHGPGWERGSTLTRDHVVRSTLSVLDDLKLQQLHVDFSFTVDPASSETIKQKLGSLHEIGMIRILDGDTPDMVLRRALGDALQLNGWRGVTLTGEIAQRDLQTFLDRTGLCPFVTLSDAADFDVYLGERQG